MITMLVQVGIIGLWATMLVLHTRRLFRLAHVEAHRQNKPLRQQLSRVWWWLGREEFWRNVQHDALRCLELTLMVFLIALSV